MSPRVDLQPDIESDLTEADSVAEIEIGRASGNIVSVSPAAAEALGYDVTELAGVSLSSIVHPDDADLVQDGISIFGDSLEWTELEGNILC